MNVAIFTDNDFAKVNGVTTTLQAVLEHAPADIRPRIYTCEDRNFDTTHYLAVKSVGVGIPFYREMKVYAPPLWRFVRAAVSDRIDLVHLTTPGPVGLAALHVARRTGCPLVGSFHTDLTAYTELLSGSSFLGRVMRDYMRWPYGRCARVLVPSDATRRTLQDGGLDDDRIRIWQRGVSTDRFRPDLRSVELRADWGVSDRRRALLYVGRLSREKGLDVLPALADRLHRSGIDHRWIVVGDGPMRPALESRSHDAIFTGTLGRDDVAVAMASADVFVFPSETDTAGNVVLEAQASGLPVLVTDKGGPRENMVDGETGFVCRGVPDFSRRIADLLTRPPERERLSCGARAYAQGRSWASALGPLFQVYREVVNAPAAEGASERPKPSEVVVGRTLGNPGLSLSSREAVSLDVAPRG
ncbi:MAG: glycosyltransferase family 4 protein [Vicinamibacterales bacterium]